MSRAQGIRIPLFGLGLSSKSTYVTAKKMTNGYMETRPQGEKSRIVFFQTPGLDLFDDSFGDTPNRGGLEFEPDNVAYVVHRGILWEINNAGVTTNRGTLNTTSGRVSMSHNGVQVMIVDGIGGYIYNTSTTVFAQITDAQFPANPTTVTFLGRRFIISLADSSRFWWSDIDDGLAWSALSFANAETSPDPVVSVWTNQGQLFLMGSITMEPWGNSGVADQPFAALQGAASEWGLAARWSIAKFDNSFACLIRNRMNQVMIAQINGYLPQKISTIDVDSEINSYAAVVDASAYSYMLGGHPMYVINFPSAGRTWLFDGSSGGWSKLKSYQLTRHRVEFSFTLINNVIAADYANGNLYRLTADALTDNGDPIEREVIGETVTAKDLSAIDIDCMRLDMETGIGVAVGQGSNPQIALSVSRDNGKTWGTEMWKTAGAIGEYLTRVEWRRLGTSRAFTPKLKITDPVPLVLVSAMLNPED